MKLNYEKLNETMNVNWMDYLVKVDWWNIFHDFVFERVALTRRRFEIIFQRLKHKFSFLIKAQTKL